MSHFTQLKTALKNKRAIQRALKQMGFTVVEEEKTLVRGFFGDTTEADFKILTKSNYDIGFQKHATGDYELVGDFELMPRVAGIEKESFLTQLRREYAKASIQITAEEKGYQVEVSENGEQIEMVVTQW